MKPHLLSLAAALCVGLFTAGAATQHDHAHAATPKGGRLLDKTEPHAEFLVEKDHTVHIHFYDHEMKPVAATTQLVTVLADAKGGKARLEFEKKNGSLVSSTPLPPGGGYNVVVQFRQTPGSKPSNFRFKLDLSVCHECKRAEYACSCDHH